MDENIKQIMKNQLIVLQELNNNGVNGDLQDVLDNSIKQTKEIIKNA